MRARLLSRPRLALFAVLLVPLFYGGLYTWSNWNPDARLDQVQAAVVNGDKPVTITGPDGKKQIVPLGRVLAGRLTGASSDRNFDWQLTDAAHAREGLRDGTFGAVVTIPPSFSAAATSTGGSAPVQATLQVQTNDAQNYLTGALSQAITTATTEAMNAQVTRTYLDNLYLGFGTLRDQLGSAAQGAGDLADGAGRLAGGVQQADRGAGQLATGLQRLASGTQALPGQTAQLNAGAQQISTGATALATGADSLSGGLTRLQQGTAALPAQSRQLASGAAQLGSGATQLATGAEGLADGAGNVATGAGLVSAAISAYSAQLQALSRTCALSGANPLYCASLSAVANGVTPLGQNVTDLGSGAQFVATGARSLSSGADRLATGATTLSAGTRRLAAAAPQLSSGIGQAAIGARRLSAGATALGSGARQLAGGTQQLAAAAPQLSTGIGQAASGASELSTGTGQLATGASQLRSGSTQLATGLAGGAQKVPSYTADQRTRLAQVAATPVVSDVQRENAVQSNGSGLAPVFIALALWIGAMAVYLLLQALSKRALASTASSARVALAGFRPGALLVGVQALLLIAVLQLVLGLDAVRGVSLVVIAVLTAVTFAALNQALVAVFGGVGRFLALILVSLQLASAGAFYPIETAPALFRVLHDVLPMTYAVDGLRACIAGGAGIGTPVFALVVWLLIGFGITVAAANRRRTLASAPAAAGLSPA